MYATQPPLPELAKVARTASTPLAVRLRRTKQSGAIPEGSSDATEDGLTPTEHARYTRLKAQGALEDKDGKNPSPAEWLQKVNERRSRIRGLRRTVQDDVTETKVLGQKVYLPNIVLRLVRNYTPPGQPYNPYEATFRIPQSVTKTDIRSLLLAVYGVETTYIRTDNYISPWYRTQEGYTRRPYKTYKRAVVGLVDPFYYPHRLEGMAPLEREERENWIEKHFSIQYTRNLQKEELLRMTKGQGRYSWKLNAPYATKRSHILRLVAERRKLRENAISSFAQGIKSVREEGETVDYERVRAKVLGYIPPYSKKERRTSQVNAHTPPSSSPSPSSTWVNSSSPPSSPLIEPLSLDAEEDEHEAPRQMRSNGVTDPLAGSYNANKSRNTSPFAPGSVNKKRRVESQSPRTTGFGTVQVPSGKDKNDMKENAEAIWEGAGTQVYETGNGEIDLMDLNKMVTLPLPSEMSDEKGDWLSTRNTKVRIFTRTQTEPANPGIRYLAPEFHGRSLSSSSMPNPTSLKFFFANNSFRTLPCELWMLSNLTVLSLRNNKISYLPPEIEQLESLVELNVARNNLKYVPAELKMMKNLNKLILFPNPFKTPPTKVHTNLETKPTPRVPPLSELILRFLVSKPVPGDLIKPRKTMLEELAVLPLATGHLYQPISEVLSHILATCVPGSVIVNDNDDVVEEFDQDDEPKFVTGIGRCMSPRHRGHRPVFVHPLEVRFSWESKIAGIDLGAKAPLRWRGCHKGCLDFLKTTTEGDLGSKVGKSGSEDGEIIQTVRFDTTEPLGFDD
ncbi:hypothetical protein CPB84DRAFT_1743944 [Gymnopilus junonius]|uniref:Large ribosomal subunit protein uL23m n=1 Tax=Gymnopilus junonius TaxID=109634 RepID=A0A9P5NUT2_GYMJU|nr:hypothetical protein CPB84DRAFT_1743944 [Gymnopilus junonius]